NETTPSQLVYSKFPYPFLNLDHKFVDDYNKIIAKTQIEIINLSITHLEYQIVQLKNNILNLQKEINFENLQEIIKKQYVLFTNELKQRFDDAHHKALRIVSRPYIVKQNQSNNFQYSGVKNNYKSHSVERSKHNEKNSKNNSNDLRQNQTYIRENSSRCRPIHKEKNLRDKSNRSRSRQKSKHSHDFTKRSNSRPKTTHTTHKRDNSNRSRSRQKSTYERNNSRRSKSRQKSSNSTSFLSRQRSKSSFRSSSRSNKRNLNLRQNNYSFRSKMKSPMTVNQPTIRFNNNYGINKNFNQSRMINQTKYDSFFSNNYENNYRKKFIFNNYNRRNISFNYNHNSNYQKRCYQPIANSNFSNVYQIQNSKIPLQYENQTPYQSNRNFRMSYSMKRNQLNKNKNDFNIDISVDNSNNIETSTNNNIETSTNDNLLFEEIDKFCRNISKRRNLENIPIVQETIDLRFEIFKKLEDYFRHNDKKNLKVNISIELKNSLNRFLKEKPFQILQCDKNVGSLLISHDDFYSLAFDHLNNPELYQQIDENPLENMVNNINSTLKTLLNNKNMSQRLYKRLYIKNFQVGKFRILPKIHKSKFGLRPIINCINHPTSSLCEFIDIILQKILKNCSTILKDSQELLQYCENMKFNTSNLYIYSCDFESPYLNIRPTHAIDAISQYLLDNLIFENNFDFDIICFRKIFELIFTSGIFEFDEKFFLQILGLPMGCKCGPSEANLYLFILEKYWVSLHSTLLYKRFIDDILIISLYEININELIEQFIYLKLNVTNANEVVFLDLKIKFDIIQKILIFDLYIKPTNSCCYLMPISNHPKHIFDNIPISLFTRIRRICSLYIDYLHHSRDLIIQLVKQGYNFKKVLAISNNIGNRDRTDILPYKIKSNKFNSDLKCFINYDINTSFLKSMIINSYNKIKDNSLALNDTKLLVVNRINKNLGSLLILNFKLNKIKRYFCTKCNIENCKTCFCIFNGSYISYKSIFIPFQTESNCESLGAVYIIKCKLYNIFYIGETGKKVKQRILEHFYSIKKFKNNLRASLSNFDNCSEVAIHFNKASHQFSKATIVDDVDDNDEDDDDEEDDNNDNENNNINNDSSSSNESIQLIED
ncbi:unnamed protein product, partial [Brachionus calyciflorus]